MQDCIEYKRTGQKTNECFRLISSNFRIGLAMSVRKTAPNNPKHYCLRVTGENPKISKGFVMANTKEPIRLETLSGRVVEDDELIRVVVERAPGTPEAAAYYEVETKDRIYRHPEHKWSVVLRAVYSALYCQERPARKPAGDIGDRG